MFIVVQHSVSDPQTFYSTAGSAAIPEHLKLLQVFPSADGAHCTCLWQADSVGAVREFIEPAIGRVGRNEYYPVDEAHALGLPTTAGAAQPA